jgi:hypothetical protein
VSHSGPEPSESGKTSCQVVSFRGEEGKRKNNNHEHWLFENAPMIYISQRGDSACLHLGVLLGWGQRQFFFLISDYRGSRY